MPDGLEPRELAGEVDWVVQPIIVMAVDNGDEAAVQRPADDLGDSVKERRINSVWRCGQRVVVPADRDTNRLESSCFPVIKVVGLRCRGP